MTGNGVRAERFLGMIAEGDVKEDAGEEDNDGDAGGGAGEEFKVKMALAEEPGAGASEESWGRLEGERLGVMGLLGHYYNIYIYYKQVLCQSDPPNRPCPTSAPQLIMDPDQI